MSINKELDFAPELPLSNASTVLSAPSVRRTILSGSMILLLGTASVSAVNLVYNVVLARSLGAVGFGHAVSIYTLLMLLSAITLSYQLVCSKFVAKNLTFAGKAEVYQSLHRRAWYVGAVVGAALVLASKLIASYLNLPNPLLIAWLGVGTAFYIPLGVRRGALQGMYEFRRLSVNFILEVLVKLGATLALLALKLGVEGVVIAVSASVLVAYLSATPSPDIRIAARQGLPASFLEGVQAIVFFIGQVIISNIDILLVKHFFPPADAGLYAAVAVVGRVVFMASWAVVSSMFPVSAGVQQIEPQQRRVVITPLILVASIGGLAAFGLWLLPDIVWKGLFGVGFQLGGQSWLPVLYVAATTIYCFSVVLIAYEMSRKIGNTGWLQLLFSFAIALGIYMFHDTLRQVILVQFALMAMLLMCVAVPFFRYKPESYTEEAGF
ncbi:MAG TPA: oligosaccharide flippase family protein, partial [Terriglobales bacterium]